jgi:hypothetical protein
MSHIHHSKREQQGRKVYIEVPEASFSTDETVASGKVTSDIFEQASAGIPPSNEQIMDVIDTTNVFLEKKQREHSLNAKTRKTVADVERVLKDAQKFVTEKNADETLQNMFVQAKVAAESTAVSASARGGSIKKAAEQAIDKAGDVARLMVVSSDFRSVLLDLVDLVEKLVYVSEHREGEGSSTNRSGSPSLSSTLESTHISENRPKIVTTTYIPTTVTTGFVPVSSRGSPINLQPTTQTSFDDLIRPSSSSFSSTSSYRQSDSFSEAEKREFRGKLSSILSKIASSPDFQKGIEDIKSLAGIVKREVLDVIYNRPTSTDANMVQIMMEAKVFLQRFSGEKTIDEFVENWRALVKLIVDDPVMNKYVDDLIGFFEHSMKNPRLLTDDGAHMRKFDDLISRGLSLFSTLQQHPYLSNIITESKAILGSIRDDPIRRKMAADLKVLAADFITVGRDGKPTLNLDLVQQLKGLLIPLLTEHLRDIPVPRITGSNDTYDYEIENLKFSVGELLPSQLHVHIEGDGDIDVQHLSTNKFVTRIVVTAENIQSTMQDIQFWFKRKSIPRTEDEGTADVELTGEGAKVLIMMTFSPERTLPFDVHAVRVATDELNIKIKDTRHDWLYNMMVNFFKGAIKERLNQEVQLRLKSIIYKINYQMNQLFDLSRQNLASAASSLLMK